MVLDPSPPPLQIKGILFRVTEEASKGNAVEGKGKLLSALLLACLEGRGKYSPFRGR